MDLDESAEPAEVPLEVIIRDPNVEQTLEYRIFLDAPPSPATEGPIDEGQIEPAGLLERPRTFALAYDMLEPGRCHKVELVVVGEFISFVEPRRPVEEGDIHEVAWWIEVTDADNPIIAEPCW